MTFHGIASTKPYFAAIRRAQFIFKMASKYEPGPIEEAPYQYKTKGYEKKPLYIISYLDQEGKAISYQRLYSKSYNQINRIMKYINHFYYNYKGEGVGGRGKLYLQKLQKLTGIHMPTLRELTLKMATSNRLLKLEGGKYTTVKKGPWILLQQAVKYIKRSKWGKKTPVYIMPYDQKFLKKR